MEDIYLKLQTPSWWFTGVFFIIVGFIIKYALLQFKISIRRYYRNSTAKMLRKIKSMRWNYYSVHYQISVERSYFVVFLLVCLFYAILLVSSPFAETLKQNIWPGIILTAPIYIAEVIWLNKSSFVKKLIERANKVV